MAKELKFDLTRIGLGKGIFIAIFLLACSADKLGSETYSLTTAYPAMYGSFSKIKVRDYIQMGLSSSDRVVVGNFTGSDGLAARGIQLKNSASPLYLYSSGGIIIGEQPSAFPTEYTQYVDLNGSSLPAMCKWVPFTLGAEKYCDSFPDRHYLAVAFGESGNTATSSKIWLSTSSAPGIDTVFEQESGTFLCCRFASH